MDYVHGKSIIKIAFADDDELLQDLLSAFIDSFENCKVVIQALNGIELLEKLAQKPDTNLILLDIKMPEMDGIEAAKKIKLHYPGMKILFTSIYRNEIVYCRIIGAGGDGYIYKNSAAPEFKRAIFGIMKSGYYFQEYAINNGKASSNQNIITGKYKISEDEIDFLKLVCSDKTYENIAAHMNTNFRRIDYIRQGLFQKFDIHNRAELAILAYNAGFYS